MRRAVLVIILAALLVSCASPAYVPDDATLAEREAQEYATRVTRGAWAWRVFLLFAIAMLTVLTGLVFFLAQVRYKVADAEARKKSADARRALLVAIDAHTVLDLYDNSIRGVAFSQTPTVIPPPFAAAIPQNVKTDGSLARFLIEAAAIVGWDSDTLPRWDRWKEKGYQMTGSEWMRRTDELAAMELIVKAPGQTTMIADGCDLRTLYDEVSTPTPPQ